MRDELKNIPDFSTLWPTLYYRRLDYRLRHEEIMYRVRHLVVETSTAIQDCHINDIVSMFKRLDEKETLAYG